ncbi:YqcC family protein [Pragia fontium]|uniref:YqcC-like domain-containing protein n=1 Tax=Pragia fontium TaxID=82985 RepID=A0ABQ5LL09_9GAMM|nr:YqcC family protein [Pragia fontium]GKX63562.1 hypothetical protein SOASR032_21310 [Pragia fontium]SUB83498.1 Domain of uncharacterised function, DUF446 [Pragia fontium]VEJ56403.1 Domain of uncharacterised function, DUF446 [Pragia fontium]
MNLENQVWMLLTKVEQLMHQQDLWSLTPPELSAFDSQEPFSIDTMSPEEWLQWVFVPRMRAVIEAHQPLPARIAIAPYFEEAFNPRPEDHQELIDTLKSIDALLNKEFSPSRRRE